MGSMTERGGLVKWLSKRAVSRRGGRSSGGLFRPGLDGGAEQGVAVPAFLRAIHGGIGAAEEGVGGRSVRGIQADADAGADRAFPAAENEGLRQGIEKPLRDRRGVFCAGDLREQHGEFVAAEPGGGIAVAQAGEQASRHALQHPVAGRVAQAVVDRLEVIQVQHHDGGHALFAAGQRQRLGEPVAEEFAVGQVGQRVVGGPMAEEFLGLLLQW